MNQVPVYKHDCDKCVFLGNMPYSGSFVPEGVISVDLYVCCLDSRVTFIARFGNDPGDYMSGFSAFWFFRNDMRDYPLIPAVKEAFLRGLIDIEVKTTEIYEIFTESCPHSTLSKEVDNEETNS